MRYHSVVAAAAILTCLAFGTPPALAGETLVHAGRFIDGRTGTVQREMTVVVEGERIKAVESGYVSRSGATVIDLKSATVLPGLIDMHDHLSSTGDRRPINRFVRTDGDSVVDAVANARETINQGFTSVRDMGSGPLTAPALDRGIKAGRIMGPRVWTALEQLGPTGGHSDPANGIRPDVDFENRGNFVMDGADEVIRSVRDHHRRGASVIKIYPSGGVASINDDPRHMLMTRQEIDAAVSAARALGLKIAAHAHGKEAIDNAVAAGVDSIEHATYADSESFALMKKHGTYIIPTLLVGDAIYKQAMTAPDSLPPTVAEKAIATAPKMKQMLRDAYMAGVKIAFGTDQGAISGRNKAEEFALMVEAGLSPTDAILSATREAAILMGAQGDIGTLQPGRFADMVAVEGDPLADVRILQDVVFVMKGGEVLKAGGRLTR